MQQYYCALCGAPEATIPDNKTLPLCDDCYSVSDLTEVK
jgi:endogenous inhibitor of DNA gyrase (YacG/DUF329 family)